MIIKIHRWKVLGEILSQLFLLGIDDEGFSMFKKALELNRESFNVLKIP
jgi:hypothetical protein